jgi:hypothetical protein
MQLDLVERELLETLWDANGLAGVLRALADIAADKARCARAVCGDEATAQTLEQIAAYLDKVADTKTVRSCPSP